MAEISGVSAELKANFPPICGGGCGINLQWRNSPEIPKNFRHCKREVSSQRKCDSKPPVPVVSITPIPQAASRVIALRTVRYLCTGNGDSWTQIIPRRRYQERSELLAQVTFIRL